MDLAAERRRAKVASLANTAHCRAVDLVTAEVVAAMRAAAIRPILLKGPAFASWLYRDGTPRGYHDSDLLVAPTGVAPASRVLRSLGFEPLYEGSVYGTSVTAPHAGTWTRGGLSGFVVDLHHTLFGAHADTEVVWAALANDTEMLQIAGTEVETAGSTANALIAALHAASNGPHHERSREDLARALDVAGPETWSAAARLAGEIKAEESFAAGLRILPGGQELAEDLELSQTKRVDALLRARGAPDGAVFLHKLGGTRGWLSRGRLLARTLVPDPDYMRTVYPLARRGLGGLLASYVVRAWRRLATLVPALRAVAAARREGRAAAAGHP